jgi:hypothetical protein
MGAERLTEPACTTRAKNAVVKPLVPVSMSQQVWVAMSFQLRSANKPLRALYFIGLQMFVSRWDASIFEPDLFPGDLPR